MGALSGLFVAALAAKMDIEEINSIGVLFVVILYGSFGFYLGTNLPSPPYGVSYRVLSGSGPRPKTYIIELVSATGTLIAALATFISVSMIVLDEIPPVIWIVAIALCWMLGVLLQLVAGTAARLGQFMGASHASSDAKRA
jgi:hypothetical protein